MFDVRERERENILLLIKLGFGDVVNPVFAMLKLPIPEVLLNAIIIDANTKFDLHVFQNSVCTC